MATPPGPSGKDPKELLDSDQTLRAAHSVAAVSAEFHSDDRYGEFYGRHAHYLGGFPGVWHVIGLAGIELEKKFVGQVEFIDLVTELVDCIYVRSSEESLPIDHEEQKRFFATLVDEAVSNLTKKWDSIQTCPYCQATKILREGSIACKIRETVSDTRTEDRKVLVHEGFRGEVQCECLRCGSGWTARPEIHYNEE